jgi:hypothetical protein
MQCNAMAHSPKYYRQLISTYGYFLSIMAPIMTLCILVFPICHTMPHLHTWYTNFENCTLQQEHHMLIWISFEQDAHLAVHTDQHQHQLQLQQGYTQKQHQEQCTQPSISMESCNIVLILLYHYFWQSWCMIHLCNHQVIERGWVPSWFYPFIFIFFLW